MIFMPPDNAYYITAACWAKNMPTPLEEIYILELLKRDHIELIQEALELLVSVDAAFTSAQQVINDDDMYQCGRQWALFAPGVHEYLECLAKQTRRSWEEMGSVCQILGFLTTRKISFELNSVLVPKAPSPVAIV